jgi:hypothetical protein
MVLIGGGQGATLSPLTAAGIAGLAAQDAGAASGLVSDTLTAHELFAHRVGASLTVGTGMLAVALALVAALVVRPPGAPRRPLLPSP